MARYHRASAVLAMAIVFVAGAATAAAPASGGVSPLRNGAVLEADADSIQIRVGSEVHNWGLNGANDPDLFGAPVPARGRRRICYASNLGTLCTEIGLGDHVDFIVRSNGKDYPQRLTGVPLSSSFDQAYQQAHRGQIEVFIPEVYELVNIAIALAPANLEKNQRYIRTGTKYYTEVKEYFSKYSGHPFVAAMNSEIKRGRYYDMKMNAYAYDFVDGEIVRSKIYDRTGFPDHWRNELESYQPMMADFARVSHFREFFASHRPFYKEQEDYYRNDVGLAKMIGWLRVQFPSVHAYDGYKVVFSPLIGGNQSVTWLESNGYREAQAHVDFPYASKRDIDTLPAAALPFKRGQIVFTELNHAFINPTADRYTADIQTAIGDRGFWTVPNTQSDGYQTALTVFEEMMNWALVALYVDDNAPDVAKEPLGTTLDAFMGERGRGFKQFAAYKTKLLELYRSRPSGATVESLYPQLIRWCAEYRVQAGAGQPASSAQTPAVETH